MIERFRWASVFVLGLLAYAPVVSLWFAADDFSHLFGYHQLLPGLSAFTYLDGQFYRPVGTVLTWNLGYSIFGTEAWPYHLLSLILHACVALLLARAIATISNDKRMGWIAGAMFAVYPLCTESVAWVAAQWDPMAGVCMLGAVWGFATYWKTRIRWVYVAALAAFTVGVFTKESVLPMPLVLPFVALATEVCSQKRGTGLAWDRGVWVGLVKRAIGLSAPFLAPAVLFVALRLFFNGSIGGYEGARIDYLNFAWDAITHAALTIVMPLNKEVFDARVTQIVGMAVSVGYLLGLFLWGRKTWALHLLAAVWWIVFLAPVLNILNYDGTSLGNRFYYYCLMGFCLSVAAVVSSTVESISRTRIKRLVPALAALVVVAAVPVNWVQLWPWEQASAQAKRLVVEMDRLLVPVAGKRLQLNLQELPHSYKGAYVFWNGFDAALNVFANRITVTKEVPQLDPMQLGATYSKMEGISGVYNMAFEMDEKHKLYHISDVSGSSIATKPPAESDKLWDFLGCSEGAEPGLQAERAEIVCAKEVISPPVQAAGYATFVPEAGDAVVRIPDLGLSTEGKTWVRLGVMMRVLEKGEGHKGTWLWQNPYDPEKLQRTEFALEPNGNWRVYWVFVLSDRVGEQLKNLQIVPVDGDSPVDIGWISVRTVR